MRDTVILAGPTAIEVLEIRSDAYQSWKTKEKCGGSQWMNVL